MKRLKDVSVGVVLGGMLFSGVSYAASATSIDVYFQPLKYFFDGVEKKAPTNQQGFIYKGTTYVPLRFVSESLEKKVSYDGPTSSIYVGKQKEGTTTYIEDMKTFTADYSRESSNISVFTTNTGQKFNHGFKLNGSYAYTKVEYLLNSEYAKFEAFIAPSEYWSSKSKSDNIGNVKIYADDKLVYNSDAIPSDLTKLVKIEVNLTGVAKLKIEIDGTSTAAEFGLLDAKFIN